MNVDANICKVHHGLLHIMRVNDFFHTSVCWAVSLYNGQQLSRNVSSLVSFGPGAESIVRVPLSEFRVKQHCQMCSCPVVTAYIGSETDSHLVTDTLYYYIGAPL